MVILGTYIDMVMLLIFIDTGVGNCYICVCQIPKFYACIVPFTCESYLYYVHCNCVLELCNNIKLCNLIMYYKVQYVHYPYKEFFIIVR